jgi:hypothetical protein
VTAIANPESFRAEARWQRVCVECGAGGPFHAHHVVDKAVLRNRAGLKGNALYDTRNAMRLCGGLVGARCHLQFENRRLRIATGKLSDDNIAYAFEVLGAYAYDYLRQEYDDSEEDPRIKLALEAT